MNTDKSTVIFSVPYDQLLDDLATKVVEKIELSKKPEDPEELIKVADIAKDNNIHVKTLLRRMDERHISKEKIGKYIAIPRKLKRELLKKSA